MRIEVEDRENDPEEISALVGAHASAELARQALRLRTDCCEAYQAVGFLVGRLGYWDLAEDDPRRVQLAKLLDNLLVASNGNPCVRRDLLPFGWRA